MEAECESELLKSAVLSQEHYLWVPMQVRALSLGEKSETTYLDLTPEYTKIVPDNESDASLGPKIRRSLNDGSNTYVNPGIHLHWTLPAAFTHIRPGADGNIKIPTVPNRWLVTRIYSSTDGECSNQSWIIESDYTSDYTSDDTEGYRSAPWLEAQSKTLRVTMLGRKTPLDDWLKNQQPRKDPPLTAFAPGNVGFSANYLSCKGVFGFYDDLSDLSRDTKINCSYFIAGWYSDKENDPLNIFKITDKNDNTLTPKERWLLRMRQQQWEISQHSKFLPTAITCYAYIQGLVWSEDDSFDNLDDSKYQVAIGNSISEAAAALVKNNTSATDDMDRLLSEIQFATLAEHRPRRADLKDSEYFEILGQLFSAQTRSHEKSFSPQKSGFYWEVVSNDSESKASDQQDTPELSVENRQKLAQKLAVLNAKQTEFDNDSTALIGLQKQLFSAWCHSQYWEAFVKKKHTNFFNGSNTPLQRLNENLTEAKKAVEAVKKKKDKSDQELAIAKKALVDELKALDEQVQGKLNLICQAMPSFWRPNDPFVLLKNAEVKLIQDGKPMLLCRVSDQTLKGIQIRSENIIINHKQLFDEIEDILPPPSEFLPNHLADLLLDMLFIEPFNAKKMALIHVRKSISNPDDTQISNVRTLINKTQNQILELIKTSAFSEYEMNIPTFKTNGISFDVNEPASLLSLLSAINLPSSRMNPVFMVWKVDWQPSFDAQSKSILEHWDFNGGIDFKIKSDIEKVDKIELEGFSLIASNLERSINNSKANFPDYAFIFKPFKNLVGQSLVGLTEMIGMQDVGLQLPPFKSIDELEINQELINLLDNQYSVGPALGLTRKEKQPDFSLARAGQLTLTRLWLIDGFGRVQEVIKSTNGNNQTDCEPIIGRALDKLNSGKMFLPPRVLQPSRLMFRWVPVSKQKYEICGGMESSPVCGLIVHNRMDKSLMIFGANDGDQSVCNKLLGAIQVITLPDGGEQVIWSTIPSNPVGNHDIHEAPSEQQIPNERLRKFVKGMLALKQNNNAFRNFRERLDQQEQHSNQASNQTLQSIIFGHPFALVRASLRLELNGPPLTDQRLEELIADTANKNREYLSLKFPVKLGDRRLGPDGLFGYYQDDGSDDAYSKICLSADQQWDKNVIDNEYFKDQNGLNVELAPDTAPIQLTLLMDPKEGVHVVSGILPVKVITLPKPIVSGILSNIETPFFVAPVITTRNKETTQSTQHTESAKPTTMEIPLPTQGHDEWSWMYYALNKTGNEEANITTNTDIHSDQNGTIELREINLSTNNEPTPSLFNSLEINEGWLKYKPSKGK